MKLLIHNRKRNPNGFTLVEVIVVLVLIAILAAIMIPAMTGWIDNAKQKRLITACRTCVLAAQTLVVESYGEQGSGFAVPGADEVKTLAGIPSGTVSNVTVTADTLDSQTGSYSNEMAIATLTYADPEGDLVTYLRSPSPHYDFSTPVGWAVGNRYEVGDILLSNGGNSNNPVLIFRCLIGHTAGNQSNTRDPMAKPNKGTWEVIGSASGEPENYISTVRYGAGVVARYNGNLYARTDYSLTGGQTPFADSSSRYWTLLGPAPADP